MSQKETVKFVLKSNKTDRVHYIYIRDGFNLKITSRQVFETSDKEVIEILRRDCEVTEITPAIESKIKEISIKQAEVEELKEEEKNLKNKK